MSNHFSQAVAEILATGAVAKYSLLLPPFHSVQIATLMQKIMSFEFDPDWDVVQWQQKKALSTTAAKCRLTSIPALKIVLKSADPERSGKPELPETFDQFAFSFAVLAFGVVDHEDSTWCQQVNEDRGDSMHEIHQLILQAMAIEMLPETGEEEEQSPDEIRRLEIEKLKRVALPESIKVDDVGE
jgi:hypothetical protein